VATWLQKSWWQDLGSGGHDGFEKLPQPCHQQVKFVYGDHSAALEEQNWDKIARFIVDAPQHRPASDFCDGGLLREDPSIFERILVKWPGSVAPLLWVVILTLLGWISALILQSQWDEWLRTVIFIIYLWGIWKGPHSIMMVTDVAFNKTAG
jgi:hypothetical protein